MGRGERKMRGKVGLGAAGARKAKRKLDQERGGKARRALMAAHSKMGNGPVVVNRQKAEKIFGRLKMRNSKRQEQTRLLDQCKARTPDKKAVLRAWAKGARFDFEPSGRWPGMYLGSVMWATEAEEQIDKAWLWEAMARQGADLAQIGPDGLGFEARAVSVGDARALKWWKSRGFGLDRSPESGDSLAELAFERAPRALGLLRELWPEEATEERVSAGIYRIARESFEGVAGIARQVELIGVRNHWAPELEKWPELVRPSEELSALMGALGASRRALETVRGLERAAMAKRERAELSRAAEPTRRSARSASL